jgi:hypothetical protein
MDALRQTDILGLVTTFEPAGGEGRVKPDVSLRFNQLELSEDVTVKDLDSLRAQLAESTLLSEVVVEPGTEVRDTFVVPTLLVVHFLSQHGVELALSIGSAALWDGIKSAYSRFRRRGEDRAPHARVVLRYKDGPMLEVDVGDEAQLRSVLQEFLRRT